jgi:hypothetical protein
LYVLVACHIERHLSLGGSDDPAEALYAFFFRYGSVQHSNPKIASSSRTLLSQNVVVRTEDGGSADMSACFQIENCVSFFESCWRALHKKLSGKFNRNHSILQFLVDALKLELGRSQRKRQASSKFGENEKIDGHFSSKNISITKTNEKRKNELDTDEEVEQLVKSYGGQTFLPLKETPAKKKPKKTKGRKQNKKRMSEASHDSRCVISSTKRRRTI